MSSENETLARRYVEEVFNKGDVAAIDELVATDFTEPDPYPGQAPGIEGEKQAVSNLRIAFPDLHLTIDGIISEGEHVVIELTVRGTQNGEFQGIPASGAPITEVQAHMLRCVGGKCVEHWGEVNCCA